MQQFLIITPCFNAAHYIDDTIMSVAAQAGEFAIHYHVQDGGSTDGTQEKLEAWSRRLNEADWPVLCGGLKFTFRSGADSGIYDAINKAFDEPGKDKSGDCMLSWINAGDRLQQGAVQTITAVRRRYPDAEWMAGGFAQINDEGSPVTNAHGVAVSQKALAAGLYDGRRLGFLQQEGVFWSHSLWLAAGGCIDPALKLAGDFDLWRRFAAHAPCHALSMVTGFFRRHADGLSSDIDGYHAEVDRLLSGPAGRQRDAVFDELRGLLAANDREGMGRAGFLGPVVVWNEQDGEWERKTALMQT